MISSRIALFTSCSWWFILNVDMLTSSNGTSLRITGHLCGEFTGHRWIPRTKASDAALWCFLWSDGWINNGEAGDLRRNRAHYDVTVMEAKYCWRRNPTESFQYCFFLLLLCNDLFINNPDVSLNVHIKINNYYHFCHKKLIFMYCIWVWQGVEGGGQISSHFGAILHEIHRNVCYVCTILLSSTVGSKETRGKARINCINGQFCRQADNLRPVIKHLYHPIKMYLMSIKAVNDIFISRWK